MTIALKQCKFKKQIDSIIKNVGENIGSQVEQMGINAFIKEFSDVAEEEIILFLNELNVSDDQLLDIAQELQNLCYENKILCVVVELLKNNGFAILEGKQSDSISYLKEINAIPKCDNVLLTIKEMKKVSKEMFFDAVEEGTKNLIQAKESLNEIYSEALKKYEELKNGLEYKDPRVEYYNSLKLKLVDSYDEFGKLSSKMLRLKSDIKDSQYSAEERKKFKNEYAETKIKLKHIKAAFESANEKLNILKPYKSNFPKPITKEEVESKKQELENMKTIKNKITFYIDLGKQVSRKYNRDRSM